MVVKRVHSFHLGMSSIALMLATAGFCFSESTPVLSLKDQEPYIRLADSWVKRLWTDVDYYVCGNPFDSRKPQWHPLQKFRPDLYTENRAVAVCKEPGLPGGGFFDVVVYRSVNTVVGSRSLRIRFLGRSDKVSAISNPLYRQHDVPYLPYILGQAPHPPLHTTEKEVKAKISDYAALFDIHDVWNDTMFNPINFHYSEGIWSFDGHLVKNGYATPYVVAFEVADLPGMPLGHFLTNLDWCPTNLPSRAVLTSGQAVSKATDYLKKYFPFKEIASRMVYCNTNWIEYIRPDYNYIRPAEGMRGLSNYVPKRDEVQLVYFIPFKSTDEGDDPSCATIYVDSRTGEMIGGTDNGK